MYLLFRSILVSLLNIMNNEIQLHSLTTFFRKFTTLTNSASKTGLKFTVSVTMITIITNIYQKPVRNIFVRKQCEFFHIDQHTFVANLSSLIKRCILQKKQLTAVNVTCA